eukprot:9079-Heterococcus_DN1.PRE.1
MTAQQSDTPTDDGVLLKFDLKTAYPSASINSDGWYCKHDGFTVVAVAFVTATVEILLTATRLCAGTALMACGAASDRKKTLLFKYYQTDKGNKKYDQDARTKH